MHADHEHWMEHTIEVARQNPNAPFGALVVHGPSQVVLASGCNHSGDGPVWHGEMDALARLKTRQPEAILYCTGEPCPMCLGAACWVGIRQVVYGTSSKTLTSFGWEQFHVRIDDLAQAAPLGACAVIGGVLEPRCDELFRAAALRSGRLKPR